MTVAGLDRVPLAHRVLEPTAPLGDVGAVLSMSGPVFGLDQPEAPAREAAEGLCVVGELGHGARVGP